MAVIDFTAVEKSDRANLIFKWETLGTGDTGDPVRMVWNVTDIIVQTFGGGGNNYNGSTLTMQGSLDKSNWVTLTDPSDNDLTFTAAGGSGIRDKYLWIRPSLSGGTSPDVDVWLMLSRTFNP